MNHVAGFLFSLAFAALVLLAFNPHFVIRIQNVLSSDPETNAPSVEDIDISPPAGKNEVAVIDIPEISSGLETSNRKDFVDPSINEPGLDTAKKDTQSTVSRDPQLALPITATPDMDNLPTIEGLYQIAKDDHWIGDAPCSVDIFNAPTSLAGLGPRRDGGKLEKALGSMTPQDVTNQPTYLFSSKAGVSLRLVEPIIRYYDVSGHRFRDVEADIVDRKPLDKASGFEDGISSDVFEIVNARREGRLAVLANLASPATLSYMTYGSGTDYRLLSNQTILTTAFIVTLPRWKTYTTASTDDQKKWDDLFCDAAHHELGHLRIRLDIYAETLDGYTAFPSGIPRQDLERMIKELQDNISAAIDERQNIYHIYNGGGLRRGMTELPYAELPFPWLETSKQAN